jgi:hypothetical protein
VNKQNTPEKVVLSALLTLSNIAVLPDWHDEFYPVLHTLYNKVDSGSPQVKLQILKLLVNLSANEDMVPSLLAAEVTSSIYTVIYRVIHKSRKHFKNSQQIDYATDHGNSYADRERNSPSFVYIISQMLSVSTFGNMADVYAIIHLFPHVC